MAYHFMPRASEESTRKARERFRELVWAAVERFQPEVGVVDFEFNDWQERLSWGPEIYVGLKHEGANGWRVIFGRGWQRRRVKAPALDKLTLDEFCTILQEQALIMARQAEQSRRATEERQEASRRYAELRDQAAQALGFPLKIEDTSRGFPYMTLDLIPVVVHGEFADEIRFGVEMRWRGLTVQQAQQLRALLQGEGVPGAEPRRA